MKKFFALLFGCSLLMAGCSTADSAESSGGEESSKFSQVEARKYCEERAKEVSNDPRHMEFSGMLDTNYSELPNGWTVTGWLEDPNGFGGVTYYDYVCTVTDSETDGHVMVDLQVQ